MLRQGTIVSRAWRGVLAAAVVAFGLGALQLRLPARASTSGPPGYDPTACGGAATPPVHAPVSIVSDADWTAANGVISGTGTAADPYVIGCWSIAVPAAGTGISVGSFALDRPFVIRDIVMTGPGPQPTTYSYGVNLAGPPSSGTADAAVENLSLSNLGWGILTTSVITTSVSPLVIAANQVSGTQYDAIKDMTSPNLLIDGNSVSGSGGFCINRSVATSGEAVRVTNNSCTANHGGGFSLTGAGGAVAPTISASANVARGNAGPGFFLNGGVDANNNTSQGNGNGFVVNAANVVDRNTIGGLGAGQNNGGDGIDITSSTGSLISFNVIQGNAVAGIQADPANTNAGFWGYASRIENNQIGYNGVGILFSGGISVGNEVSGTTWTDGGTSITDFGDTNTIVDAGSANNKRVAAGTAVVFNDYTARMTLGPGQAPTVGALPQAGAATSVCWDFGDHASGANNNVCVPATQGHTPPMAVSHTYASAQTLPYQATLTVTGVTATGQAVTYTAAVPVVVS